MLTKDEPHLFRVIDLKQYAYCPRILYYHTVLSHIRPITYKMEAGIAAHNATEEKEKRRSLRAYGLKDGTRHFNVALHDIGLRLSGEIDMVIETDDMLIPIDFKNAKRGGKHFRLQLVAYARLLEVTWGKPVSRGFLYLIPHRRAIPVTITPYLRRELDKAIAELHHITDAERMPSPTSRLSRCVDCEFRRFCNDTI